MYVASSLYEDDENFGKFVKQMVRRIKEKIPRAPTRLRSTLVQRIKASRSSIPRSTIARRVKIIPRISIPMSTIAKRIKVTSPRKILNIKGKKYVCTL